MLFKYLEAGSVGQSTDGKVCGRLAFLVSFVHCRVSFFEIAGEVLGVEEWAAWKVLLQPGFDRGKEGGIARQLEGQGFVVF